jgi:hypothetical protein
MPDAKSRMENSLLLRHVIVPPLFSLSATLKTRPNRSEDGAYAAWNVSPCEAARQYSSRQAGGTFTGIDDPGFVELSPAVQNRSRGVNAGRHTSINI